MQASIRVGLAGTILAICAFAQRGEANEIADFYSGKSVSIVVGHDQQGGHDLYARVLARHLGRHIPGSPSVVVQNMAGGSGIIAANWLENIAPKDGTVMATFVHTVAFEPLFGNTHAKYDPAKLNWIGNMEESTGICGVAQSSGITTFDDLFIKEGVFGATGATGTLAQYPRAVKNLTGARLKVVHGYKGSPAVKFAMARGEVHGICGLPLTTVETFWRDEYKSGEFKPILQLSGKPHPKLKRLPHIDSYAKTGQDKQVFGLIFGAQVLGRMYVSPSSQPPPRTKALRTALMETIKDKAFMADAVKTKIAVEPMSGEDVAALIAEYSAVSPAVVERAKQATSRN